MPKQESDGHIVHMVISAITDISALLWREETIPKDG